MSLGPSLRRALRLFFLTSLLISTAHSVCLTTGQYGEWGAWGNCVPGWYNSTSGISTRIRDCIPLPFGCTPTGPVSCPGNYSQVQWCFYTTSTSSTTTTTMSTTMAETTASTSIEMTSTVEETTALDTTVRSTVGTTTESATEGMTSAEDSTTSAATSEETTERTTDSADQTTQGSSSAETVTENSSEETTEETTSSRGEEETTPMMETTTDSGLTDGPPPSNSSCRKCVNLHPLPARPGDGKAISIVDHSFPTEGACRVATITCKAPDDEIAVIESETGDVLASGPYSAKLHLMCVDKAAWTAKGAIISGGYRCVSRSAFTRTTAEDSETSEVQTTETQIEETTTEMGITVSTVPAPTCTTCSNLPVDFTTSMRDGTTILDHHIENGCSFVSISCFDPDNLSNATLSYNNSPSDVLADGMMANASLVCDRSGKWRESKRNDEVASVMCSTLSKCNACADLQITMFSHVNQTVEDAASVLNMYTLDDCDHALFTCRPTDSNSTRLVRAIFNGGLRGEAPTSSYTSSFSCSHDGVWVETGTSETVQSISCVYQALPPTTTTTTTTTLKPLTTTSKASTTTSAPTTIFPGIDPSNPCMNCSNLVVSIPGHREGSTTLQHKLDKCLAVSVFCQPQQKGDRVDLYVNGQSVEWRGSNFNRTFDCNGESEWVDEASGTLIDNVACVVKNHSTDTTESPEITVTSQTISIGDTDGTTTDGESTTGESGAPTDMTTERTTNAITGESSVETTVEATSDEVTTGRSESLTETTTEGMTTTDESSERTTSEGAMTSGESESPTEMPTGMTTNATEDSTVKATSDATSDGATTTGESESPTNVTSDGMTTTEESTEITTSDGATTGESESPTEMTTEGTNTTETSEGTTMEATEETTTRGATEGSTSGELTEGTTQVSSEVSSEVPLTTEVSTEETVDTDIPSVNITSSPSSTSTTTSHPTTTTSVMREPADSTTTIAPLTTTTPFTVQCRSCSNLLASSDTNLAPNQYNGMLVLDHSFSSTQCTTVRVSCFSNSNTDTATILANGAIPLCSAIGETEFTMTCTSNEQWSTALPGSGTSFIVKSASCRSTVADLTVITTTQPGIPTIATTTFTPQTTTTSFGQPRCSTCADLAITRINSEGFVNGLSTVERGMDSNGCRSVNVTCTGVTASNVISIFDGNSTIASGVGTQSASFSCNEQAAWIFSSQIVDHVGCAYQLQSVTEPVMTTTTSTTSTAVSSATTTIIPPSSTSSTTTTTSFSSTSTTTIPTTTTVFKAQCGSCSNLVAAPLTNLAVNEYNGMLVLDHSFSNSTICRTVNVECVSNSNADMAAIITNDAVPLSSAYGEASFKLSCSSSGQWTTILPGTETSFTVTSASCRATVTPSTTIQPGVSTTTTSTTTTIPPTTTTEVGQLRCSACTDLAIIHVEVEGLVNGLSTVERGIDSNGCRSVKVICAGISTSNNVTIFDQGNSLLSGVGTQTASFMCNDQAVWAFGTEVVDDIGCAYEGEAESTTSATTTTTTTFPSTTTTTVRSSTSTITTMTTASPSTSTTSTVALTTTTSTSTSSTTTTTASTITVPSTTSATTTTTNTSPSTTTSVSTANPALCNSCVNMKAVTLSSIADTQHYGILVVDHFIALDACRVVIIRCRAQNPFDTATILLNGATTAAAAVSQVSTSMTCNNQGQFLRLGVEITSASCVITRNAEGQTPTPGLTTTTISSPTTTAPGSAACGNCDRTSIASSATDYTAGFLTLDLRFVDQCIALTMLCESITSGQSVSLINSDGSTLATQVGSITTSLACTDSAIWVVEGTPIAVSGLKCIIVQPTTTTTTKTPPSGSCDGVAWAEWHEWSDCTDTCGSCGTHQRFRACSKPSGSTCSCSGSAYEKEPCNIEVCRYPRPSSCCPGFSPSSSNGRFLCSPTRR